MSRNEFPETSGLLAVWATVSTNEGEDVQRLLGVYRGTPAAEAAADRFAAIAEYMEISAFEVDVDRVDWESGFVTD